MTPSLDKREQELNQAYSYLMRAYSLDLIMHSAHLEIVEVNKKGDTMTGADKIRLLTAKSLHQSALMQRESCLKQGYDHLRYYFGDHEANKLDEGSANATIRDIEKSAQ